MSRIPQRQPLSVQAAVIIADMINSGDFQKRLPGERALATQLQIGRDTLRAALNLLEADQVISPRAHGKRRDILGTAAHNTSTSSPKRIAFLSPKKLAQLPPWMLVEFDSLRELLNQRGYELKLTSPGLFHLKNPAKKLAALIDDTDAAAWILYQCPSQVQQWFHKQKIASLIRGYPQPDIEIPFIDEDWEAAAYHAGTQLKRLGHRRIVLLMPESNLAGLMATKIGLCKAFKEDEDAVIPVIEKGSAKQVGLALSRVISQDDPPTAIVATRSRQTLSTISWATRQALLIPKDLSLITIAAEPWFQHLLPLPSHYFSDPENFARAVVRQIIPIAQGKSTGSFQKLLIPEYISGGTLAPPTNRQQEIPKRL
ncbi:MAG: DNA-binding LacI/PurR family transcriptional regulator [Paracoccaceae bacterium]|jgi:DNA-binding LacI/PurR family transcriptional regulator